uniref:Uncharacterized protein n=1 Tax=Anguilla anguilla TaxID=7936 RepID=A0A0E9Q3E0_ANGAN
MSSSINKAMTKKKFSNVVIVKSRKCDAFFSKCLQNYILSLSIDLETFCELFFKL